jgi:hypothetical protein
MKQSLLAFILGVCASLAVFQSIPAFAGKAATYKVVSGQSDQKMEPILNQLASEGWKLHSVTGYLLIMVKE